MSISPGVDGAHRHLQLPPDAGAGDREVRHRAAARRHHPPRPASGEVGAKLALTEPDAGTDLQAIRLTARREATTTC